jgi:protein-disulfide isomerase
VTGACQGSHKGRQVIDSTASRNYVHGEGANRQEGNRLGVDGTPFFFINGHAISGGVDLADFKKLMEAALKEAAGPNMTPVPGR